MQNHYAHIAKSLNYTREKYGLQICIKDFCGFIPINRELDEALRPFLAHTNPFCMYIKQDKTKYYACLSLIRRIHDKFAAGQDVFYGMCHAGLGEYVIPIRYDDILLGSINVGFFQTNERRSEYLIRRCCAGSDELSADAALRLYRRYIHTATADVEDVLQNMCLLAEYLGNTYQAIQTAHTGTAETDRARYKSSEDTIITHAMEYIRQNYATNIRVSELALFCHCSESYLSRIFKKRLGVNINVYINKVRVELSKNYLLLTNQPIAEIALVSGFSDPNYYSRVFAALIGHPPSEFRRRFSGDATMAPPLPGQ